MYTLENKRILVTGGTGSLGKVLIRRLLSGELGMPKKIIVLSRDEAKQHAMRVDYLKKARQDGAESSRKYADLIDYRIGDVRDFHSVASALKWTWCSMPLRSNKCRPVNIFHTRRS